VTGHNLKDTKTNLKFRNNKCSVLSEPKLVLLSVRQLQPLPTMLKHYSFPLSLIALLPALLGICRAQETVFENSYLTDSTPDFRVNVLAQQLKLSNVHSNETFTTIYSPRDPSRSIRVKKTSFCDSTVKCVNFNCSSRYFTHSLTPVLTQDTWTLIMGLSICSSTSTSLEVILMRMMSLCGSMVVRVYPRQWAC
jgi:hypothetical protein